MEKACKNQNFDGPIEFTGKEVFAGLPGAIPAPYGKFDETVVEAGSGSKPEAEDENTATTTSVNEAEPTASEGAQEESDEESYEGDPEAVDEDDEGDEDDDQEGKGDDEAGQTPGTESPALKISEDGRRGGSTGQTCQGSSFGDCCSKKGRCGRKTKHCACGCQNDFGNCRE
jgi:hypothetical protein